MATTQDAIGLQVAPAQRAQAIGGLRFDWLAVGTSAWLLGGLFLDGWAHNHDKVDTSFFTPWHALLYSGYLVTALVLFGTMILNHIRGYSWGRALPAGYQLSLLGVALFGFGGAADMAWHEIFGFEVNTEALLSPTHLLLATGIVLMVTGPARAAWRRAQSRGWAALLPMLLSATMFLSALTFMMQFIHPLVNPWNATGFRPSNAVEIRLAAGVAAMMLQSALLMGLTMFLMRRWTLPFGSLTLMQTLNAALLATQNDTYHLIPIAAVGGLVADLLAWKLRPSAARTGALRFFAFAVPFVLYGLYFVFLAVTERLWWSVHMWTGTVVLTGVVSLLVSYLVTPGEITAQPESPLSESERGRG
jgi:hypothetical protein